MSNFVVYTPGGLSTIQDKGRYGYQSKGMPVAGAMDDFAFRMANIILGNDENAAAIEATLLGPSLNFLDDNMICVCGADMEPKINGFPIKIWKAYKVTTGDELTLSSAKTGVRSYISFFSGIEVPEVMGSKSTYMKAHVGGFHGRALKAGDRLFTTSTLVASHPISQLPEQHIPLYSNDITVRAVPGPNEEFFSLEGQNSFFSQVFTVSPRSDRMGIFLQGESIALAGQNTDIISAPITMGSIQVTSSGEPIILMADRQTAGGYAQIATVISCDLGRLAQLRPGGHVRFEKIDIDNAQKIVWAYENNMDSLKNQFIQKQIVKKVYYYTISLNDTNYKTIVEEL